MFSLFVSTQSRIGQRDVARAAGCHFSTVSLALRNHPSIPKATCNRLQALAKKLGYVPDPFLASLAHYRNGRRPVSFHATLAWVTNHAVKSAWRDVPLFLDYFEGAKKRATDLGYRLEEFWLREPGMTSSRAAQILRTRGISGLVVAPQPEPGTMIEFDWDSFSAVSIGFSLAKPRLHLVCPHQFGAIRLAVLELAARGYRRPGLVLLRASNDRVDQSWQAGFLVAQEHLELEMPIPPLLLQAWDEPAFADWMKEYRPDVLLTKFLEVPPALRRLKLSVPRAVGLAFLTYANTAKGLAGVFENPHEVGAAAIDYLTGMIHRSERGVPVLPRRLLIEGTWMNGRTVRPAERRASPLASVE